jgi:hypothetical protein
MKKLITSLLSCFAVLLFMAPIAANAVPTTRTYDFSVDFGGAIAPDPATGTLTVTFDPDGGDVFGATTATLDSANFAVDGTLVFNFFTATDSIQVGGALNGLGGVFDNTNDFLLSLDFIASATPILPAGLTFLAQTGFNQATNVSGSVSIAAAVPEPVTIDIKPGDDPNTIKPSSKHKIPVAVLFTESFDPAQVDFATVEFGPGGATESHGRAHVEDVDGDGDMDLLLHFNTQDTGIACGDTEATLTGETFGGDSITGSDSIVTVKCD